jgi:type II secretory pathway component PulK
MTALRTAWVFLTRPRGHLRHRFYRGGRRSRGGVALLMTISAILLLTVLVTEIAHGAVVRVQLAAQHRDDLKSQALAYSGASFHRLVLIASKAVGRNPMFQQFSAMLGGGNAQELWQALPFVDTRLMRFLFVTDGAVDEDEARDAKTQGLTDEQVDESREGVSALKRNFLDFDGDFRSEVQDEERRINVGNLQAATMGDMLLLPQAQQIMAMLATEDNQEYLYDQNLVREELVGNLIDWTDLDDQRVYQGGSESSLYSRLKDPYKPKNAPFDTREEIRLVEGWNRDGMWERVGRYLTIYGTGKVNVNTALEPVLTGLLIAYYDGFATQDTVQETVRDLIRTRGAPIEEGGLFFNSGGHFYNVITNGQFDIAPLPLKQEIKQVITSTSTIFRVNSTGEVGHARTQVHVVFDFTNDPTGRIVFWQIR